MNDLSQAAPHSSKHYTWLMVIIGFTLTGMSFGGLSSVGVFLKPLATEFNWSRGEVSLGYTMVGLAAFMGIVWGYLADRYSARPFAILGVLGMVASLLLLGRQAALWQLYTLYFLFGALGHSVLGGPLYATVGFWFTRNKGLAIGLMASGGALGQAVVPYIASTLIAADGWRAAYTALGFGYAAVGLPLALLVRDPPSRSNAARAAGAGMDEGHSFPVPPTETTIWICAAVIFCCTCMSVPIVHVVPLVSDRGIDPQAAAGVLTVLMLFGGIGRIMGGKLADMIGSLNAYVFSSFAQTALVLWFPFVVTADRVTPEVYVFAATFGLFYSGVMTSILVCVREMIPARMNAQSMGFVSFFAMIGMGFGGYHGGLMFDLTGNYVWSYANAAIAGLINLTILAAFYLRIRGRMAALSAA